MLEVYLDDLRDLLATSKEKLTIMNDKGGDGIIINGLTVKQVKSADEVHQNRPLSHPFAIWSETAALISPFVAPG